MHTNLELDLSPDVALPASIIGFEGKIFHQTKVGLFEGRIADSDPLLDTTKTIREAEAKQARGESVSDVKSDFLDDISHEIRTPMGAIIGLSHVLLATKLDDRQRQCVTVLQAAAEALLAMVSRALETEKIKARTANPHNAPFDMAALLNQITQIMAIKAQEKGIGLTLHYEASAPTVFIGDSGQIRQIVMNLVGNAIKFTNVGEVVVTFSESGNDISISVTDTGIGISENKFSIIFDRFTQADSSISRKYGGTGLGLSISKKLAEGMGGGINVTSVVGEGSTFVFYLQLPVAESGGEKVCQKNIIYLDSERDVKSIRRRKSSSVRSSATK